MTILSQQYNKSVSWAKSNPEELLIGLAIFFTLSLLFAALTIFFMSKTPEYEAPEPLRAPTKWSFVSRVKAGGGQVCDLYKRDYVTKARCYGMDENGKWVLRNIF